MKQGKIAVLGATGNIGREVLQCLADKGVDVNDVIALASDRSAGAVLSYGEEDDINVASSNNFDYSKVGLVISTLKDEIAQSLLPKIAAGGTVVIDAAGAFRTDPDVPLVVPEINAETIKNAKRNIIACPGAAATFIGMVINKLHDAAQVTRVVATTFQSVSMAGREAMDELFSQTRSIYVNDPVTKEHFAKQIAFNVIPQTAPFREDGTTEDEFQLAIDVKKLVDPKIKVTATCTYVPVFLGQGIALNLEFKNDMDADTARKLLKSTPGVSVVDLRADEGFVTPVEVVGEDRVYVSRIRDDITVENGISLWVAADNMRKGSALNAVDIALAWGNRKLN